MSILLQPLLPPCATEQAGSQEGRASLVGGAGHADVPQTSSLHTFFPLRKPLLAARAGTGRKTSHRAFNLQLK